MWTPRRVFLVICGVLVFGVIYGGYSRLLGWVDGLPPLPKEYTQTMTDRNTPLPAFNATPIQQRLQQAFGPACIEQQDLYTLKLEVRDKGILFAAVASEIMSDGRVQFVQLSVAIFGKNQEISTLHCDRAVLEFDQPVRKLEDMASRKVLAAELHADPDSPTEDPRKGKVHITNNRRTPKNPDDDLIVKSPGPIFYRDDPNRPLASNSPPPPSHPSIAGRLPHIWTYNHVELVDRQNRPTPAQTDIAVPPHTVVADGMRMYLTVEAPPAPNSPKKAEKSNVGKVTGVDRIDLDRNVVMNLWSENRNMFGGDKPATGPTPAAAPAPVVPVAPAKAGPPPPPAPRSLITIQTNGSFYYDMVKDLSHFERPEPDPKIPQYITVTRRGKGLDTLTCDFLDIQFRRKKPGETVPPKGSANATPAPAPKAPNPAPPTGGSQQESDMDIEWIHAWGKDIALSSEAEKLDAYGYDLVYNSLAKRTVLKGQPMVAVKENNQIKAKELIMSDLDDHEKQNARAIGPGEVGMGDFDDNTGDFSRRALWQDELLMKRIKENGKEFDLLTLTGGSEFRDSMNAQSLRGRQLKLWLLVNSPEPDKPMPKTPAKVEPKKTADGKPETKQPLPYRLEATGHVRANSPEMIIHDADYLNVWFKDLPPAVVETLPMPGDPTKPPLPGMDPVVGKQPAKKDSPLPKKDPSKKDELAKKDDPAKVPIEMLHAGRIETWVNRTAGKNDLDRVHCEGKVRIIQKPTPENKNGVRIEGTTVDLEHFVEGNNLLVTGNDEMIGQVHFDTIAIVARDIHIDQRRNEAHVKGWGWMQLQSATDMEGKKLEKPVPIEIQWDDSMELEGPTGWVLYEGKVEAKQKDGFISCENMQVKLDRPLWLNNVNRPEPKPGEVKENPKVERILCDQAVKMVPGQKAREKKPVAMQDEEYIKGKLTKFQRVEGISTEMDNPQSLVTTHGPGNVRIFQEGAADILEQPTAKNPPKVAPKEKKDAPAKPNANSEQEMKLTLIRFKGLMKAYNKDRRAVFLDQVEIVHFPSKRHDVELKPGDPLPLNGMQMTCDKSLEMKSFVEIRKDAQGKDYEYKWQEMAGVGNVRVRTAEYTAWATRMTYSEEKGLVIFYGDPETQTLAVLTQAGAKGEERKKYQGSQIKYWTKTKDIQVIDGIGGQGN